MKTFILVLIALVAAFVAAGAAVTHIDTVTYVATVVALLCAAISMTKK